MSSLSKANKIFLSINKFQQSPAEKRLFTTLERAGFLFSNQTASPKNDVDNIDIDIENSICSIHFIEKKQFDSGSDSSKSEFHFDKARTKIEKDGQYKTFIWMPGKFDDSDADKKQLAFINKLQHHLSNNMILSRVPSAIQFVEDVKLVLEQQAKKNYKTEPTDVFLIFNQTDEKEASRIQLMLSSILKVVKLSIVQDSGIDYEEYAGQQMDVSKLSVVYYKNAVEWAIPFIQQIWKKVGGASSKSPILFICDSQTSNQGIKNFVAPRVTSFILPAELVPLEIKVQFDAIEEKTK